MSTPVLHGYFRSSACWRVRLALNLKGIAYEDRFVHLAKGEQQAAAYQALNPQGLIPLLEIDGLRLVQSLAIIDYLEETRPDPALLPGDAGARAAIRAVASVIACDTHPVQNLKILKRVAALTGDKEAAQAWARTAIAEGLAACEALVPPGDGFAFGEGPTLADIMIVPQLTNARRFGVDVAAYPRLLALEAACTPLPAFARARPEMQADYEG